MSTGQFYGCVFLPVLALCALMPTCGKPIPREIRVLKVGDCVSLMGLTAIQVECGDTVQISEVVP
jgi:hypothetical protein